MKTYVVQMMNTTSYSRYMEGYMDGYHVETIPIIANSAEEAYRRAKEAFPNYHINTYVKEV